MSGYARKDVVEITNTTGFMVQSWTDQELLSPDISAPKGKGYHRRYSKRNILEILIIRTLNSLGMPLRTIKEIIALLRKLRAREQRYFDPEADVLQKAQVYLIVFDHHDPEKLAVSVRLNINPDHYEFAGHTREQVQKIREDFNKADVDMEKRRGAVVIDINDLWREVANKV